MNYELALKLKEAGFPQPETCCSAEDKMYAGTVITDVDGNRVYVPTFTELIEACGSDFNELVRCDYDFEKEEESIFFECRKDYMDYTPIKGKTPTEAVANLYLSLHGKKAD